MTIARDYVSEPGFEDSPSRNLSGVGEGGVPTDAVPFQIRAERLARQVQSFERAGYRLETQSALQAIVVKPTERRPARSATLIVVTLGLYLIPLVLGIGKSYHRVAITVDRSGAVRLA